MLIMIKKIAIISTALVLLYTVTGFFILPAWLRPKLEQQFSSVLKRDVSVRVVRVNPFTLSARIFGFTVREKQAKEPFLSFDELYLNVQARSLIKGGLVVREVSLIHPEVHITRLDDKTYNFSDLLGRTKPVNAQKKSRPFLFSVGNISIRSGKITFRDLAARAEHQATDINLSIPFVSNIDDFLDVYVKPRFSARINGTLFTLDGQSKPFKDSLETSLALNLKGISLPFYMAYLPPDLKIRVPSGTIDLDTKLSYVQYKGKKASLNAAGNITVHALEVQEGTGEPLLKVQEARFTIAPSPLLEKKLTLKAITMDSPELSVTRSKTGKLNVTSLTTGRKDEKDDKNSSMTVNLESITITGGTVRYTDLSKESPVRLVLSEVKAKAAGLSTKQGTRGRVDISSRLNTNCSLTAGATMELKPFVCDAQVGIDGLEPVWLQPYFTDTLRIYVTRGSISSRAAVSAEKRKGSPLKATFAGNIRLNDFASADKTSADDFIRCRALSLDNMKLGINPGYLDIDTVRFTNLFSRIQIGPDRKMNLATIVKKKDTGKKDAKKPAPEKKKTFERIAVKEVIFENSQVRFMDRSVRGGYAAELGKLTGTIRGISSNRSARADVNLTAMLNRNAPLRIKGRINPFRENLFVDLHTTLTGLDLSPMTPYSGKFAGYAIEKGKLSLDLTYLIDHKELDSKNKVLIDQFNFGESVDSEAATRLPVKFAVSLLKDADGRIKIRLPVKGRTDDPEFSVLRIIGQIIKNIIVKAATSPFALLESLYPGASELNSVEFAPGRSDLKDQELRKLDSLAKILADKPSLRLDISGYVDQEQDRQGLAEYQFEKKLKAQKLKDLMKKGQEAASIQKITISPEEYAHYLGKAYAAEEFPKPKNALGLAAKLPVKEMETLMRKNIEIKESDLRLLALNRSQRVQEHLVTDLRVDASRIFLIETRPSDLPGNDTGKDRDASLSSMLGPDEDRRSGSGNAADQQDGAGENAQKSNSRVVMMLK